MIHIAPNPQSKNRKMKETSFGTTKIHFWWTEHTKTIIILIIGVTAIIAAVRMGYEFWRLISMTGPDGAIDLRLRYNEVLSWFSGQTVYQDPSRAGYAPASYVMLWPFVGWLDFRQVRWLWAATSALALGGLICLVVKEIGAKTTLERSFWILMLLSVYPMAITIGNGQLGIHIILAIIGCVLILLPERKVSFGGDLLAAVLFVFALTKLNFTIPFLWVVLLVPGRLRPIMLTGLGYGALTLLAVSMRSEPVWILFSDFFHMTSELVNRQSGAHLANFMTALGLEEWVSLGSVVFLGILGIWVNGNRHADLWILLGVSGIVARLWTYHRMYDDLLILLPMIALYRVAKQGYQVNRGSGIAGILFVCGWIGLEMPGTLGRMSFPWNLPYDIGQTIIWSAMLVFLIIYARQTKRPTVVEQQGLAS
jgi:hypothetical protein